ncbi:uncharacterized protein si:ch211-171b20.3 isoform X1 [Acipenser ruthenus]|uniref:uncharacterized protein si:ch211-171b20.3 isoform X1 n=1 Tax=Acipenser ruthenus TaxID=7906 RepID=UPI002741514C|nr:uncharacterized protein si:ch211-171b20.3 isoform X1 [Acipenser ruthenus]
MATPKLMTLSTTTDIRRVPSNWELLGGLGQQIHQLNQNLGVGKCPGGLTLPKPNSLTMMRRKNIPTLRLQDKSLSKDREYPKTNCVIEGSAFSSLGPKEDQKRTTLDSDHKYLNEDFPEKHFLFEKWNGVPGPQCENKALSLDMRLLQKNSVPRDPRSIQRLPLHKELFQGVSKPFAFGSYEGFHLTSEPAVFLPPCTTAISEKQQLTVDKHKNRSSNRTYSLYSIPGNQKSCAYADPVSGASTPFIQRLSEILSLESDTVRQEKTKKLKKNKKQES